MLDAWDVRLSGALLIAGPVLFLVGAARWDVAFQGEMRNALRAIDAQRARWQWISAWMIVGTIVTTLGLAGLLRLLALSGEAVLGLIGLVLFALAAALWVIHSTFRLTVTLWAARQTAADDEVPASYPALASWMGLLHAAYMVPGYLAAAAFGAGIVRAEMLDTWVGWTGVGIGLGAAIGFALVRGGDPFAPPINPHVWPFIAGIMLLVQLG